MTEEITWSKHAELVASFNSRSDGRPRWTELELWFDPGVVGKRVWRAVAKGCSVVKGEVTKTRELAAGTMSRALTLFDPSTDAGRIMRSQALDWLDENRARVEGEPAFKAGASGGDDVPVLCMDDQAALKALFGTDAPLKAQADALGLGESTLRMQLKNGTDVRVALRAILPFVDVEAFRRAKGIAA